MRTDMHPNDGAQSFAEDTTRSKDALRRLPPASDAHARR